MNAYRIGRVNIKAHPQQVIKSGQWFQEDVSSLVRELIASSNEKEKGFLQIEVQMAARATRIT